MEVPGPVQAVSNTLAKRRLWASAHNVILWSATDIDSRRFREPLLPGYSIWFAVSIAKEAGLTPAVRR
jgi:hypothetical protein